MVGKALHCIRHGLAVHNVMFNYIGFKAFTDYYDTPLLHEGYIQAETLSNTWVHKKNIELVVVSPLMRTLQTCVNIFKNTDVPIIALDSLLEYPFGGDENCNKRKNKSLLSANFPQINFDNITEEPEWQTNRSTIDDLEKRRQLFLNYIEHREEKHIAVVSHSSWLNYFLYKDTEFKNELEHCKPYVYLHANINIGQ